MTRLKSVPPRQSEYSSRRHCQMKDDSPSPAASPSAESEAAANEGALSASGSPHPLMEVGSVSASTLGDMDADPSEAGADSSSCSSAAPSTRSVALGLVTWQLFQQEKTRINAAMTDSMFIDWMLTNIRPSSSFLQQFRSPQAASQEASAAPETSTATPSSSQALPSAETETAASLPLLPNMQLAAAAAGSTPVTAADAVHHVGGGAYSASPNRLFCAICRKHFSSRAGLIQHQRGMHAWQPHFRCNKCGQRFRWASQLHDHRRKGYCPCVNMAAPATPPSGSAVPEAPLPTMAPPPPAVTFAAALTSGGSVKDAGMDREIDCGSSNSPVEDELDEGPGGAKGGADMDELIQAVGEGGAAAAAVAAVTCPECAFSATSRADLERHFKSDHVVEDLFPCTCGSDFPCLSLFLCHYICCPIAATDLGMQQGQARPKAPAAQEPPQAQPQPPQETEKQPQQPQPATPAAAIMPLPTGEPPALAVAPSTAANEPPPLTFGPQAVPAGFAMAPGPAGGYPPLRGAPMTPHEAALTAAGIAVGRPRAPNGQASCQYCHQTFSNKNTLKQHIIGMHSHQAQYHCEHCGKPFRWAPSYYTHRRKCGMALCGLGPSPRGRGRAATAAVGRY